MEGSLKYSLSGGDWVKIAKGAMLAAGGAMLAYFSTEVIPNLDQSTALGALAAGVGSILLNVLRKYLTDGRNSTVRM